MGGRTGLRYESLYPLLDRRDLTAQQWDGLFEDMQVMEQAALAAMHSRA